MKCAVPPPTIRPYMTVGWVLAVSRSVFRNVVGCRFVSLVNALRITVPNSSCLKSRSCRYGPCSSTTTLKPAEESSFAITPPEAPAPKRIGCNPTLARLPVNPQNV